MNEELMRRESLCEWIDNLTTEDMIKLLLELDSKNKLLTDELNQEKENNKKLREEKEAFVRGYSEAREDEANTFMNSYKQKQIYEKVIDRMAKQISCLSRNLDNATNFERVSEEEYNIDFIKQYYFKKARGEEDVKD